MPRDIFRDEWRQPAVPLPGNEVRRIRRVDHVGGADVARKFLVDPLKQPLRAGALDLHLDARILRLEGLTSFSPTGRSIEEYRITFASLRAASISVDEIDTGSGAAALSGAANMVAPRAAEPLMRSRLLRVLR